MYKPVGAFVVGLQRSFAPFLRELFSKASAVALAVATVGPASAGGSNTSSPAPTPPTPTPLVTSQPQLSTVGAGGCAWQYTKAINDLTDQGLFQTQQGLVKSDQALGKTSDALASDYAGLGLEAGSVAVQIAGATARAINLFGAGTAISSILGFPAAGPLLITQAGFETAESVALATLSLGGLGAQSAGVAYSQEAQNFNVQAQTFNEQALAFSQQQAALNTYVTETLPLCDTTFTGTVTVSGGGVNVTGNSIFNNNVGVVGDVNVGGNVTASTVQTTQGISAFDGAITIGDPGLTTYSSGITIGGGALSGAGTGGAMAFTGDVSAIAIGNGSSAQNVNDTALGTGAMATGGGSTALGASAEASAMGSIAVGDASATNTSAIAVGTGAMASGVGSIAIGQGATATGSIAMGVMSQASNGGAAYGDNSTATGRKATAVGPDATALPDGSAAFGQGATAQLSDQQVFGTSSNTYTTPGITSDRSQHRQSGPLELVTTDSNGNLASDNGETFTTIAKLQAGVAIALAAEAPSLTSSENFGLRIGWGNLDGVSNAVAASAMGVLCRSCLMQGDRLSIDGSIGAGWSDYKTYSPGNVVGGRAGLQWTW